MTQIARKHFKIVLVTMRVVCIFILCVLQYVTVTDEARVVAEQFEKDAAIVDVLCNETTLGWGTTQSEMMCAAICSLNSMCVSFFYNKEEKLCNGASTVLGTASGCQSKLGTVYYKLAGIVLLYSLLR